MMLVDASKRDGCRGKRAGIGSPAQLADLLDSIVKAGKGRLIQVFMVVKVEK
jgi:hypothetical protein